MNFFGSVLAESPRQQTTLTNKQRLKDGRYVGTLREAMEALRDRAAHLPKAELHARSAVAGLEQKHVGALHVLTFN